MSLCLECGCGFCCDGTLYLHAPLKAEDFPLQVKRIEVAKGPETAAAGENGFFFRLPCKCSVNDKCTAYGEHRPAICGEYRCRLLANHEAGRVTVAEARALVENLKAIRQRLRPKLEAFTGLQGTPSFVDLVLGAVEKVEGMQAGERRNVPADMLLDIASMRVLLAKNFDSRLTNYTYQADKAMRTMQSTEGPSTAPEAGFGE